MNSRGNDLAIDEALQAGGAAFRTVSDPASAFAEGPFQQGVVAAADGEHIRNLQTATEFARGAWELVAKRRSSGG